MWIFSVIWVIWHVIIISDWLDAMSFTDKHRYVGDPRRRAVSMCLILTLICDVGMYFKV